MTKKTTLCVKFLIFVSLCLTSCVSGCTTIQLSGAQSKEDIPRHAFVQIQQTVELEGCGLDEVSGKKKCQKANTIDDGGYEE